jgi:hypothetical protein
VHRKLGDPEAVIGSEAKDPHTASRDVLVELGGDHDLADRALTISTSASSKPVPIEMRPAKPTP